LVEVLHECQGEQHTATARDSPPRRPSSCVAASSLAASPPGSPGRAPGAGLRHALSARRKRDGDGALTLGLLSLAKLRVGRSLLHWGC
jgi:hypothetical protein